MRILEKLRPLLLCMVSVAASPLFAAEKTMVVIENDPADGTTPENSMGLPPAPATAVLATSLADAVAKVKAQCQPGDCIKHLHFRGHGAPGLQNVGGGVHQGKVGERINGHSGEWKDKLKELTFCPGAVIHLWGCNVGSCDMGATKLKEIADALGVTVRGAVDTVYAGEQESYSGPIQEAKPGESKPEHKAATVEPGKKKQEIESEDSGCDGSPSTDDYGEGNGQLDSEDTGCDGTPGTHDTGEGDGIVSSCASGSGEDVGCDGLPGSGDYGEGNGQLDTEDVDGNGFDLTSPLCQLIAIRNGPPKEIDIRVQDTGVGLAGIDILVQENTSIAMPGFAVGTDDPLVITATKLDQTQASRVELQVTDLAGNYTICDPVMVDVARAAGRPADETFTGLRAEEDTVTVENGSPGLGKLEVVVNGRVFRITELDDGEKRNLDVSPAMLPGNGNVFTLRAFGKPGSSAAVLIWDGE